MSQRDRLAECLLQMHQLQTVVIPTIIKDLTKDLGQHTISLFNKKETLSDKKDTSLASIKPPEASGKTMKDIAIDYFKNWIDGVDKSGSGGNGGNGGSGSDGSGVINNVAFDPFDTGLENRLRLVCELLGSPALAHAHPKPNRVCARAPAHPDHPNPKQPNPVLRHPNTNPKPTRSSHIRDHDRVRIVIAHADTLMDSLALTQVNKLLFFMT